ncbi:MAG: hypothetical protein GQ574_23210 [Crocinitomix sp.]|nr:hypothetical protein [Crocinitomix sp.]
MTNTKGIGLELNIEQKYLEMLDGKLTFEGEKNKETTFYITISINQ